MDDMPTDRLATMYRYVYGKLLNENPNASCRMMNYEEYDNYMKKCDETEGFDVDGCTGRMPGRIGPVPKGGSEYGVAEIVAKHAAWAQGEAMGIPIELVHLVKVNCQPVEGALFYLTFVAVTVNDMEITYKAKVWLKPTNMCEIILFMEEASDGNKDITVTKKVDKPRGRGKTTVEENIMFNLSHCFPSPIDRSSDKDEIFGISSGQLHRDGFYLLVKELKMKNPQWTHAKARRTASNIWKRGYPQKAPYLKEARKNFERQHPEYYPDTI